MKILETPLRFAALFAVTVAALTVAWSYSTRTTEVGLGMVWRENLLTGRAQVCGVWQGQPWCRPLAEPSPRFDGRPVSGGE